METHGGGGIRKTLVKFHAWMMDQNRHVIQQAQNAIEL